MKKIEVYTRPGCGYCVGAKRLLKSQGLDFIEHDTARDSAKLNEMRERSPQRIFPQIFINNQLVGGFDDLLILNNKQGLLN